MTEEVVPPGQPTDDKAGPLLPALATNTTPCLSTRLVNSSNTGLQDSRKHTVHEYTYIHIHVCIYPLLVQ